MKKILSLALFSASASLAGAQSVSAEFMAQCERRLPPTQIEIVMATAPLKYDFSKSVGELTSRLSTGKGQVTLGLTERAISSQMEVQSTKMKSPGADVVCMRPRVVVTLTLDPHTVFVGREFPEKTCAFNSILEHEQRHVLVNNMALTKTAASLRQALQQSFGNRVFYGEERDLSSAVQAHIQEWISWAEQEMKKVDRLHKQIDAPAEYAKNQHVCGGEIPRRLGSTRG